MPAPKLERPRSLSLYSEEEQKHRTSELSTVPTPALPDHQPTPFVAAETLPIERSRRQSTSVSASAAAVTESRATSAAFGPLVDHQTTEAFASMHLESKTDNKPPSTGVGSVKASPSCAQEVSGNGTGHLDLKFYHSPLW